MPVNEVLQCISAQDVSHWDYPRRIQGKNHPFVCNPRIRIEETYILLDEDNERHHYALMMWGLVLYYFHPPHLQVLPETSEAEVVHVDVGKVKTEMSATVEPNRTKTIPPPQSTLE